LLDFFVLDIGLCHRKGTRIMYDEACIEEPSF